MIVLNDKRISKWPFWREKGMLIYCLASGVLMLLYMAVGYFVIQSLLFHKYEWWGIVTAGCSGMLCGSFFGIAYWYDNERRYKLWLESQEE
ncbi:MAG: hypothetical protein ACRCR3_06850 [Tannerellaceae bacterium]